jgi:hypothetical protein
MSSRNMCLLPRATLHSDSEHIGLVQIFKNSLEIFFNKQFSDCKIFCCVRTHMLVIEQLKGLTPWTASPDYIERKRGEARHHSHGVTLWAKSFNIISQGRFFYLHNMTVKGCMCLFFISLFKLMTLGREMIASLFAVFGQSKGPNLHQVVSWEIQQMYTETVTETKYSE